MTEKDLRTNQNSRWPVSEMLLTGTFATKTPQEKRYKLRAKISSILMGCWILLAFVYRAHPFPGMRVITLLLPGPFFTYLAWEKRRYFLSLDELSRQIELEGMAWAYSLGVIVALWAGGAAYAISSKWPLDPRLISWMPFFLFAMFLASVKATYRYFATRRY